MLRRRTAVWILSAACTSFSATAFAQDDTATTPATDDPVTTGDTTTSGTADATMQMTTPNTDMTTQEASSPGFDGEDDDDEDDDRFFLALRAGYAFPLGEVAEGIDLNDSISGQVPFGIDIGYRVIPNLVLGVYGTYGLTFAKDCPDGFDCSVNNFRFGVQAQYHIAPRESVNPWVGAGIGYEILRTKLEGGGTSTEVSADGFEFANLQAGVDFRVSEHVSIGPLVNFTLSRFSSVEVDESGGADPEAQELEDKGLHEWLTIGGRVAFDL